MNLRYLLLALTLLLLMTSCGLVAAVVPPIELNDPFGVEGESITTEFAAANAGALGTLAESTAEASAGRSFADQELDLRGFSLARLNAAIGLDAKVTLSAPVGASYPETFTLTKISATAKVSDDVNGTAEMTIENDVNLQFTKSASCDALSCNYTFSGERDDLKAALQISETDRSKLAKFVKVIRLEGSNSQNRGGFTLSVTADSDPVLDGFKATFILRSGESNIKLGG